VAVLLALAAAAATLLLGGGPAGDPLRPPLIEPGDGDDDFDVAGFDPVGYDDFDEDDLLRRGRDGYAHVLYEKSPGGVEATAIRVDAFEPLIEAAAERHDVDAETLGALVFLESAGRPEVMATGDPEGATGLAQILPGTAEDLLGMSVDLEESVRLTRRIERAERRAARARTARRQNAFERQAARLRARRRRVDERFDPTAALDGAARYLALAEERFGREDLAAASYHMGIGNLESVIAAYVAPRPLSATSRETVADYELSYVRLYFDSSPTRNPRTFRRLLSFGDDSRHYLFRLEAAREIRRLHAEEPEELERLAALHGAKASAEEVLRPREDNAPYEDGDALRDAYEAGELVPLPRGPERLGYRIDRRMGELARRLDEPPGLYRGLRPEALATLLYVAKEVRRITGGSGTLNVTSTVRDLGYQELLVERNAQATPAFSLHTTGYALDIERNLRPGTERALVHVLERLRATGVIDWVFEPSAIHLTTGPDAERLLPLYEAVVGTG
jgi:hypothetical protein